MSNLVVTTNYVLQPSQSLSFGDADYGFAGAQSQTGAAILLDGPASAQDPSFTDEGAVSISVDSGAGNNTVYGIQEIDRTTPTTESVKIAQGGSFTLTSNSPGTVSQPATGYIGAASFENDGSFTLQEGVNGVQPLTGVKFTNTADFINTGTFTVNAGDNYYFGGAAVGVVGAGAFQNSGTVQVTGETALAFDIGGGSLTNSGSITATSARPYTEVIGIDPRPASEWTTTAVDITNTSTGTINDAGQYLYAIKASGESGGPYAATTYSQVVDLSNAGVINGNIDLGNGPPGGAGVVQAAVIHNTGTINGVITLTAAGDDLYDGRGGTETAQTYSGEPTEGIALGGGVDTIYLGNDGELVSDPNGVTTSASQALVTGGAGNDTITGGLGDDVIDGGAGHNTLNGGGGDNTWSFASAASGVTASLALQGTAQNTWGSTVDTATNFQNLTGSAHNDVLIGDASANVINGGAGNDTLTGGGGADTFVFASGSGQDVITDFSSDLGAQIDLSGYRMIHSFAQIEAMLSQSGPNTVLDLPGGGTVTLDNVTAASLTASDFHIGEQLMGDFNGDGMGDIFWQTAGGITSVWEMDGSTVTQGVGFGSEPGWQIQDVGDFEGGAYSGDVLWRNTTTGMVDLWTDTAGQMSGHDVAQVTLDWSIMGAADFNGDGKSDILWRNEDNGDVSIWLMNGDQITGSWNPGQVGLEWKIVGAGDYYGDGRADILWRNTATGDIDIWTFDSNGQAHGVTVGNLPTQWQVVGSGDFNGDGKDDILWRDTTSGQTVIWEMNGAQVEAFGTVATLGLQWKVAAVTDVNGDGKDDIIWRDSGTGETVVWTMNGPYNTSQTVLGFVDTSWQIVNHHFDWA